MPGRSLPTGPRSRIISVLVSALAAAAMVSVASSCSSFDADSLAASGSDGASDSPTNAEAASSGDAFDVDAGFSCATSSLFLCDDFDGTGLNARWERATMNGGVIDRTDAGFRSAPLALYAASSGRAADAGAGWAFLQSALGATAERIIVAHDLRVDGMASTQAVADAIYIDRGSDRYGFQVFVSGSGDFRIREVQTVSGVEKMVGEYPFTILPSPSTWARLTLDLDLSPQGSSFRASLGGVVVVNQATVVPPFRDGSRVAMVGLQYFESNGWRLLMDNATIELR
jgi:hypothetical protein